MKAGEVYVIREALTGAKGTKWLIYCKLKKYLGKDTWFVEFWWWSKITGHQDFSVEETTGSHLYIDFVKVSNSSELPNDKI